MPPMTEPLEGPGDWISRKDYIRFWKEHPTLRPMPQHMRTDMPRMPCDPEPPKPKKVDEKEMQMVFEANDRGSAAKGAPIRRDDKRAQKVVNLDEKRVSMITDSFWHLADDCDEADLAKDMADINTTPIRQYSRNVPNDFTQNNSRLYINRPTKSIEMNRNYL